MNTAASATPQSSKRTRPEFAPCLDIVRTRKFLGTADLARDAGERSRGQGYRRHQGRTRWPAHHGRGPRRKRTRRSSRLTIQLPERPAQEEAQ
jgi:hypothetical protein